MTHRATLLIAAVALAGCAGGEGRVTGSIVGVEGDLDGIVAFEIQSGGSRYRFVPDDGLDAFGDDGTPLTHLFEHLQTGDPVRVTYRVEDGENVAILVEDG